MSRRRRTTVLLIVMLGAVIMLAAWISSSTPTTARDNPVNVTLTGTPPNATHTRTPSPVISATCTPRPSQTPTPPVTPPPCWLLTNIILNADFNTGSLSPLVSTVVLTDTGGWAAVNESTSCVVDYAAVAPDPPSVSDQRLSTQWDRLIRSDALTATMSFNHSFTFQPLDGGYRDGGVLELSTDSGQTWFDAGSRITGGRYNGTITRTGETCNGITPPFTNGQNAWVGTGSSLVSVNLSEFIGQSIMFRFRLGTDCSGGGQEWRIDDVKVVAQYRYMCTPSATPTATEPPGTTTPSTTVIPSVDLQPWGGLEPAGCPPNALARLTTHAGGGTVPVTTTMRFSSLNGGTRDFVVPPFTGGYIVECTGSPPCAYGGVYYSLTVDVYNDFPETDETNNTVQWTQYSPPACTPTPPPPTATPTVCAIGGIWFADVPPTNTFYPFVRCLACKLIVSGYPCGGVSEPCDPDNRPFFRPNNPVTRGQAAKIVSESAQFYDPVPPTQQTFADVPYDSPFWLWVERLSSRGVMSGYPCGGQGEPCDSQNHPYFRPNAGATRGQLAKIVSEAAGFLNIVPDTQQTFTDVAPGSTFWVYIERLILNRPGVMSGYPCGGAGEPCDSVNRPYFRPNNGVTRGQSTKIVAGTFFPGCSPLLR